MNLLKIAFSNDVGTFKEAKNSRFLPNAVIAPFIAILLLLLGTFLCAIPFSFLKLLIPQIRGSIISEAFIVTFWRIGDTLGPILAVFIWMKFIEKREFKTIGFPKDSFIKKYIIGFILGIIMMTSCVLLLYYLDMIEINRMVSAHKYADLSGVFIVILGWVVQGASEEIICRGWLLNVIGAKHNVPLGIFISSTLFSALHLMNNSISYLALINIVLFGIFASLYSINEGSLWGICGLHSSWNWAQGNLFGLEVSGGIAKGGVLVNLKTDGNTILTGGNFGPEGGLIVTSILTIGILTVFFLLMSKILRRTPITF